MADLTIDEEWLILDIVAKLDNAIRLLDKVIAEKEART